MTIELFNLIQPTPESINAVKKNYNRLLARVEKANDFLKTIQDQDKYAIEIRIELLEPMANYINLLEQWKVKVEPEEIRDGFRMEGLQ